LSRIAKSLLAAIGDLNSKALHLSAKHLDRRQILMNRMTIKRVRRARRKQGIRKEIFGMPDRPRLSVYRSLNHVYAQVIDDLTGKTVVSASTRDKSFADKGAKMSEATAVGKLVAQRAKEKGISKVVFDRNGYLYHGRIKALADGAREGGLQF
jgi:large subunit ribosomal protein L18